MSKEQVRAQFGSHAAAYATSTVHAKGAIWATGRLVATAGLARARRRTAAGHTAFTFAPHVAHVVATDMRRSARRRQLAAEGHRQRDIEDATPGTALRRRRFDLVTCRIAAPLSARNRFVAGGAPCAWRPRRT